MRYHLIMDADDTLWENNIYFEQAIHNFVTFLDHSLLSREEVRAVLDEVEHLMGYGSVNFTKSLVETYRRLAEKDLQEEDIEQVRRFGEQIRSQPLQLLAGVRETLVYLSPRHDLFLLTKGDSEEQFRQVFEESPSGILLIEEDLRIRHANPALCRLLGYDNSELRQLTLPAILPQDSASDVTRRRVDQRYRTKSGEAVWVNVNETVIRNSQGGVMYNLALVEDITARRKADQEILAMKGSLERSVEQRTAELAETNRRLESSNKELESFAYSVSHDLRAPLRSIDSFSQIILEEYADRLDAEGAQFLLVPATNIWWLTHYRELREHLEARFQVHRWEEEVGALFDLRTARRHRLRSRPGRKQ